MSDLWNLKVKPMLAFPSEPFNDKNWIFEIKWDGTRAVAYISKSGKKVRFLNRRLLWFEYRYPELKEIYSCIKAEKVILDGEIVVLEQGKPEFYKLANREHVDDKLKIELLSKTIPATFIAFDILYLDGKDLTSLPLIKRKEILKERVMENAGKHLIISRFVEEKGKEFFKSVKDLGLEGIVGKKKDSPYEIGRRSKNWLKIKAFKTLDAVICGYTEGEGERRQSLGALVLGVYDKGKLRYVGRVGTGFSESELSFLKSVLGRLRIKENPFDVFEEEPEIIRKIKWVKPKVVCEVKFMEVTKDGKLRAPSFLRLRFDKPAKECMLELNN